MRISSQPGAGTNVEFWLPGIEGAATSRTKPAPEVEAKAGYTLTILGDAQNEGGATRFVEFLLSDKGRALLRQHGVDVIKPTVTGNARAVPASLQAAIKAVQ